MKREDIIDNKYKFREILIALCMPLYDYRYLNPFNFTARLWVIHYMTDYYKVNAPILNAAKHCTIYWSNAICYNTFAEPNLITEDSDYHPYGYYERV